MSTSKFTKKQINAIFSEMKNHNVKKITLRKKHAAKQPVKDAINNVLNQNDLDDFEVSSIVLSSNGCPPGQTLMPEYDENGDFTGRFICR